MAITIPDDLVQTGGRIILVVLDGVGGLPAAATGLTELETALTPHLDRLARASSLGLHTPVGPGITPGSGPGHLALFGYDPLAYAIGRGVLSALGVGFELEPGDLAVRLNFATLAGDGRVVDRRAGRPSDEANRRLVAKLRDRVRAPAGVRVFFEAEKEHRACLVLRGEGIMAGLSDTDPQETGVPPLAVRPLVPAAAHAASVLQQVLDAAGEVLADESVANGVLARGIDAYSPLPTLEQRFGLRGAVYARYPMYRGAARLVGMHAHPVPESDEANARLLVEYASEYDFHFIHVKAIDSRGEDGDFAAKVGAIEAADALLAIVERAGADVIVVTGDHSTPSSMRTHSWHPVPLLIHSPYVRSDPDARFGERACRAGELGIVAAKDIMALALAHAGRLQKYGA
jgi:2,3-bisphosphoglycerate-independent phosphoglycerate mutase